MPLVTAYRADTGQTVTIPQHWLGHPVLGANFTAEPPMQDDQVDPDIYILGVTDTSEPDYHIAGEFNSNPEEGEPNAIYPV